MDEKKFLKGAIIVIGSLFWENEENAINSELGKLRNKWREACLDTQNTEKIKCKIRYGRISSSRHDTYTMLFSNDCPAQGNALLIPIKNLIPIDEDFTEVNRQAFELAKVEQICKDGEVNLFKNWGSVALKIMPSLNADLGDRLRIWWSTKFKGF